MALKIRLRQQGRSNRLTYRVVVTEGRTRRDGKYIEMIGWYDPSLSEKNAHVDAERALHWINQGAQVSENVKSIIAREAPSVLKEQREKTLLKQKRLSEKRKEKKAAK